MNGSSDIEQVDLEIKKYFIYKNFLFEVINKANENFEQTLKNQSFIRRFKGFVSGISVEIDKEKLDIKNVYAEVILKENKKFIRIENKNEISELEEKLKNII